VGFARSYILYKEDDDLSQYHIKMRQSNLFYFSSFGHQKTESGQNITSNMCSQYILHFVVKGKVHCQIDGIRVEFSAGQGFMVSPPSTVIYISDIVDPWECYFVSFNGTESEELMHNFGIDKENLAFSFQGPDIIRNIYQKLVDLFGMQSNNIYSYLGNLFIIFSLINSNKKADIETMVDKIKEYIHMFYMIDISVEKISKYFKLNRSYLFRIFKQNTGTSIIQYIVDYRISRAKNLLMIDQMNITEVSYSCGFGSSSHFASVFKEKTGQTPKEFQKLLLKR
jgi:AraC-like DNA-binding protein